ncbi:LPXTG cell wall anchor domain-containing protein, partial [Staphylococcus aureus]
VELDSDGNQVTVNVAGANNYTIDSGFVKTQVEPPKPGVPNTPPTTPEKPGVPNTPPTTPEKHKESKKLPDTGKESVVNTSGFIATLLAMIGFGIISTRRKNKQN